MDYSTPQHKSVIKTIAAQGKRYRAKADVSNCFPSLYTHALDWALRGFKTAKQGQRGNSWEHKLDQRVQNCHDGETKGVMIGPAISNILSELVLQRIDERLRSEGFKFTRYVDDYEAYFDSRQEAELFLSRLDTTLTEYRLTINTRKTRIDSLRLGFGEAWMNEVLAHLPASDGVVAALRYLQQCEHLAIKHPAQSVLTYGVKTFLRNRGYPSIGDSRTMLPKHKVDIPLLHELVRLAYIHPHLTSLMVNHLWFTAPILSKAEREGVGEIAVKMLHEAAQRGETDTMLWLIYALRKVLKIRIKVDLIDILVETRDDLVWTALAATSASGLNRVLKRVSSMDLQDVTDCQEHWLSRYELYRTKKLPDSQIHPNQEKQWFGVARSKQLKFSILK